MKRLLFLACVLPMLILPCRAMEFTAPTAPDSAVQYMPEEPDNFAEGLLYILSAASEHLYPAFSGAVRICVYMLVIAFLVGVCNSLPNSSSGVTVAGLCVGSILVLQPVDALLKLGINTVQELSEYGRLLVPVMAGALAAQGSVTRSGALYTATVFIDSLLVSVLSRFVAPLVYSYLCIGIAEGLSGQPILKQLKGAVKWLMVWGLKLVLYGFTGYVSITGVISGTTDAALLKATKVSISSMVPVIGSILSDASEAVLVSAGLMKNAAGIYGLLALLAVAIGPFLRIGVQYLMLKISAGICHTIGSKHIGELVTDVSTCMGFLVATVGSVGLILMISTICFMGGSG